eukprot:g33274.t1
MASGPLQGFAVLKESCSRNSSNSTNDPGDPGSAATTTLLTLPRGRLRAYCCLESMPGGLVHAHNVAATAPPTPFQPRRWKRKEEEKKKRRKAHRESDATGLERKDADEPKHYL